MRIVSSGWQVLGPSTRDVAYTPPQHHRRGLRRFSRNQIRIVVNRQRPCWRKAHGMYSGARLVEVPCWSYRQVMKPKPTTPRT